MIILSNDLILGVRILIPIVQMRKQGGEVDEGHRLIKQRGIVGIEVQ